ncbi:MAG: alpha/beta fold hydrolase, partial [Stackebrandtia sp.]
LQVARRLGAEVFATASPPKQHLLRQLGLDEEHIASTRTLDFRDRFLDVTGGAGMHVVLNTLAGKYTDASLDLLPGGGRFVELGKTDVRDPEKVAADHPGVDYRYFDLDDPDEVGAGLRRLSELFSTNVFQPPLINAWPIDRAPEAFDLMRRAEHLGKIVFTMPRGRDADKTVLITGGTGTLGGLLARHLVAAHGVRHLLLTSRRGPEAEGAAELRARLEEMGAQVTVAACDAADRDAVAKLIADVPADRPLGTVIHAAGVLDDGVVEGLTAERTARVLRAKAESAAHLDALTAGLDLDAFVLYSSAAGALGSPGQANYAAATAYLDGLARDRRRRGLPATSLAWGLWEQESGMTRHLSRRKGRAGLGTEEGLALFDAALEADEPGVVAARLDVARLREQAAAGKLPPIFARLVAAPMRRAAAAPAATREDSSALERKLAGATAAERERILLDVVRAHAAAVLRLGDTGELGADRAFREVGFDSLTSVELRNRLNAATGLRLPASLVFDHPTPAALARSLVPRLTGGEASGEPDATPRADAPPGQPAESLSGLFLQASADGRLLEARSLAVRLADFRAAFARPAELPDKPRLTPLREGSDEPTLICVPSFVWQQNLYYYARLAAGFPDGRRVAALDLPGFGDGEPLPASADALAEVLAEAVRQAADGGRFALLGHSWGGLVAGSVAARLENVGAGPEALVLLDTPEWNPDDIPKWYPKLFTHLCGMAGRIEDAGGEGEAWITAGCKYSTFDFSVSRLDAPTLLVRAGELLPALEPETDGWKVAWRLEHTAADVSGDHFTMLEAEHAAKCARTVDDWLRGLPAANGR